MVESIAFRTRARTIDHLGREQIADCPTAISELWKNSYDAYARKVELRIFHGEIPVAAILDDGHGMNYQEFVEKWLVVGTESKLLAEEVDQADRNGLPQRPRQGQKGIGRLSAANLGPLMFVVSKRSTDKFVAALLDWRIFENPYLVLSDIKIPVAEFVKKEDIFSMMPNLFEFLTENVLGRVGGKQSSEDKSRNHRVKLAWDMYDASVETTAIDSGETPLIPSETILNTLIGATFNIEHLENWDVWHGRSKTGTALLIADVDYDLQVHLVKDDSPTAVNARNRFSETLSSFVDPFYDPNSVDVNGVETDFDYAVYAHLQNAVQPIISRVKDFNRGSISEMEHVIEGTIDIHGVFHGRVKAFGEWLDVANECIIEPPKDLRIPVRANSKVGAFDFFVSTYERDRGSTTHSDDEFERFEKYARKFSGFLVFRNGLRVLPFGREDNDFFEIEMRRSKQAGREFWNARRMFGRLGLSSTENPNLKDKAGREGFIDNVATKTLKLLIENILKQSARTYFGLDSDVRKTRLPEVKAANLERRAREAKIKLRKKNRRLFRGRLRKYLIELPEFLSSIESLVSTEMNNLDQVLELQEMLGDARDRFSDFRLPGAPKPLGTLEEDFSNYLSYVRECKKLLEKISSQIDLAIERINPAKPVEILENQRQRSAGQIHSKIKKWKATITKLQNHESERVVELVRDRNKIFHSDSEAIFLSLQQNRIELVEALAQLEQLREVLDDENSEIFESYIGAIESLSESIDLEVLALATSDENDELRTELDRLNGLAQLGITIEILAHELVSYDDMIGMGIAKLPKDLQKSKAVGDIRVGYEGLSNQLQFLSPLQLSGQKIEKWISGRDIYSYVSTFFSTQLNESGIEFSVSPDFEKFKVFERPSRLYPVFINLVNNSIYWVKANSGIDGRISFSVMNQKVIISDNGLGVDELDVSKLFSLFFTRKTRGGRGVGLYLARANLSPRGHKIKYATDDSERVLEGANFTLDFKGAEYD